MLNLSLAVHEDESWNDTILFFQKTVPHLLRKKMCRWTVFAKFFWICPIVTNGHETYLYVAFRYATCWCHFFLVLGVELIRRCLDYCCTKIFHVCWNWRSRVFPTSLCCNSCSWNFLDVFCESREPRKSLIIESGRGLKNSSVVRFKLRDGPANERVSAIIF